MEEDLIGLEFQHDCIKEVLDKYGLTHEKFCNNLIGFVLDILHAIFQQKNGFKIVESALEEIDDESNDCILNILAEAKVKIFQMENSPLWKKFNENQ